MTRRRAQRIRRRLNAFRRSRSHGHLAFAALKELRSMGAIYKLRGRALRLKLAMWRHIVYVQFGNYRSLAEDHDAHVRQHITDALARRY